MRMKNRDAFSALHPLVGFLYFALVLTFSMSFMHPVCLGISLLCALAYGLRLYGKKALRQCLWLLPMLLLAALVNPAFNHEGATILTYLPSGNPLTLESIAYGAAAATMLFAVLLWFSCLNAVMPSDKFVYLFGRTIPALSLVLSMTLRFVPKFAARAKVVAAAQRGAGKGTGRRGKTALAVFSVLVTWSLENAVDTADSMKSRGYGLPGRTAFSIYRFDSRDRAALLWLAFCGIYIVSGWISGGLRFRYYPTLLGVTPGAFPVSFWLVYLALCLTPVILDWKEERTWKQLKSVA